jgi:hypothetical protein
MHIAVFNAHIGLADGGELVALNIAKAVAGLKCFVNN